MVMAWMLWRQHGMMWRCWKGARLVPRVTSPFQFHCRKWSVGSRGVSGLCRSLGQSLLILIVPPDPVELRGSCASHKEVDTKQVPVLWDDDQWVSGPDQACGCQHCRLGGTEFFCWASHISQTSYNQTPFKHRGPEEDGFGTCRVVVQRSQFGGQNMLDPVQDPVVGRSQCSHVSKCSDGE